VRRKAEDPRKHIPVHWVLKVAIALFIVLFVASVLIWLLNL
jgi:hypothetical protein